MIQIKLVSNLGCSFTLTLTLCLSLCLVTMALESTYSHSLSIEKVACASLCTPWEHSCMWVYKMVQELDNHLQEVCILLKFLCCFWLFKRAPVVLCLPENLGPREFFWFSKMKNMGHLCRWAYTAHDLTPEHCITNHIGCTHSLLFVVAVVYKKGSSGSCACLFYWCAGREEGCEFKASMCCQWDPVSTSALY